MFAYHVVTDRPMYVGQQIIFDEKHHSGVYQRVYDKIDIVNDIYANPNKYDPERLEHHTSVALLERLHKMAFENNYEVLTIVLRGDVEMLYKRYLNRMHNENRHPVHLSTTLDVFDDFKSCTEYLRTEKIPGNIICINANDFSYQTDKEILRKIDEFMGRC